MDLAADKKLIGWKSCRSQEWLQGFACVVRVQVCVQSFPLNVIIFLQMCEGRGALECQDTLIDKATKAKLKTLSHFYLPTDTTH